MSEKHKLARRERRDKMIYQSDTYSAYRSADAIEESDYKAGDDINALRLAVKYESDLVQQAINDLKAAQEEVEQLKRERDEYLTSSCVHAGACAGPTTPDQWSPIIDELNSITEDICRLWLSGIFDNKNWDSETWNAFNRLSEYVSKRGVLAELSKESEHVSKI